MDEFCHNHGFVGWFETSAKENIGINEGIKYLVNHVEFILLLSFISSEEILYFQILTIQKAGEYEIPVMEQHKDVQKVKDDENKLRDVNKKKSCC